MLSESKSFAFINSDLPISAQRNNGDADKIFDIVDDRDTADFPSSLDNTFWVLQRDSLYCGGLLYHHPEFKMNEPTWRSKFNGIQHINYLQSTLYRLHTSHKQALKLRNLCINIYASTW